MFLNESCLIFLSLEQSQDAESALSADSICQVLQGLESRSLSSSDISLLHQMKSFVLLQDVARLTDAMEEFHLCALMPPGMFSVHQHAAKVLLLVHHNLNFFLCTKSKVVLQRTFFVFRICLPVCV